MKTIMKALLTIAAVTALALAGLSALYTTELAQELTTLRRENRSDLVYLRGRIRELESDLKQTLRQPLGEGEDLPSVSTEVTETQPSTSSGALTEAPSEDTAPEATEPPTGEVTLPVHQSPETKEDEPSEPEAALYLLCANEGTLGVFDGTGNLLRRVNVLTATLPKADRDALSVGIPVFSEAELEELLEKYG